MDPVGVSIALACGAAMYAFVWHRQRMEGPDGQVLAQLKAAGSDLRRPHEIDLFFHWLEARFGRPEGSAFLTRLSDDPVRARSARKRTLSQGNSHDSSSPVLPVAPQARNVLHRHRP